jgi:carbon monoxide dehydrogenase subunit G
MLAYVRREHIDRPPAAAFRVITAVELAPGWAPGVVRVEHATPQPLRVGSVLREVRRLPVGKEVESELTVVELDPPSRYAVTSRLGQVTTTWTYEVGPDERGTSVVLTCRVDAPPSDLRTATMLGRVLKRQDRKLLKSLRRTVESMP